MNVKFKRKGLLSLLNKKLAVLMFIFPGLTKANTCVDYMLSPDRPRDVMAANNHLLTIQEDFVENTVYGSDAFQYTLKKIKPISSIADLNTALKTAGPGDMLLLADGTYDLKTDIEVAARGRSGKPIILAAAHSGQVILTGKGGLVLKAPAAYIEIRDFVFKNASSSAMSTAGTSHCRWTHNVFETTGDGNDLTIAGDYQEVDHNSFLNKDAMGRFLAIRGHGSQIAKYLWIHHNYFAHYKDQGGKNGAEAFQFGLSGYSMSTSTSLVEYNLFEDCNGEAELISVKASGVTLRYNTFRDSKAQFTLRHGNHCNVYGNYFFNTPGIRFFGDDHRIYSNYFENCPLAIQIGNGDGEVADGAKLTCHDRPDRVFIGFNTLINNKTGFYFGRRHNGLGATAIQITGNLIEGGEAVARVQQGGGLILRPIWTDNVYYAVGSTGDLPLADNPPSALYNREENPKLIRDTPKNKDPKREKIENGGVMHLSKNSPTLYIQSNVPAFITKGQLTDIDGQPRKGKLMIGADQCSRARKINFPLTRPSLGQVGITQSR